MKEFDYIKKSPLFEPVNPSLKLLERAGQIPSIYILNNLLKIKNISFVAQSSKTNKFEDLYEPRIYEKGEVQTRENSWHDFFNALVWHSFTQSKRAINYLHYCLQKKRYPEKQRLPAENMLTIFDEHGAIILSKNALLHDLIRERRWHELFWQRREQIKSELQIIIFGHGLYEKALNPYVGLCAHSLLLLCEDSKSVDSLVCEYLLEKNFNLRTKDLSPVPILGFPGWWESNSEEAFYSNTNYFRTK